MPDEAATVSPRPPGGTIPSGRTASWRPPAAFLVLAGAHLLAYASYNGLTPVLALYLVSAGHDPAFVGLTIATFSVTSVLVRPFAGIIVDRAAKPRVYGVGAVVLGLATLGYLMPGVAAVLGFRFIQGAVWAVINTAAPAMAVELAPDSARGRAIGLLNMVRSLALPIAPPLALGLLAASGFPAVLTLLAGAGVLSAVLVWTVPARARGDGRIGRPTLGSLVERTAVLPAGLEALVYATAPLFFAFLPLHAAAIGVGDVAVVYLAAGVTMVMVQPLGRLSDTRGRLPIAGLGFAFAAVALVVLALATNLPGMMLGGVLWAAGASLVEPATTAMAVDRAPAERRGAALATYTSAFQVGNAAGATAWGWLIVVVGSAVPAFALGAGVALVGLVASAGLAARGLDRRGAGEAAA
jgi:MFS family permease